MTVHNTLAGRIALVTGASGGLGGQFARTLAGAGATVLVASRRIEKLQDLTAEIAASGGVAHPFEMDVRQTASIETAVARMEAEIGPIDILVNNSGVTSTERMHQVTEAEFAYVFETNVRGALFTAKEVGARMIARAKAAPGKANNGRVINIASIAGIRTIAQVGVYGMSKAAVVHMTKSLALEWGRFNINTNAICPGYIDTDMTHDFWKTPQGQKMIEALPRRRVGSPSDLDALILLLAGDASGIINGAVITADDGFTV